MVGNSHDRVGTVTAFAYNLNAVLVAEQPFDTVTCEWFVVNDECSDHHQLPSGGRHLSNGGLLFAIVENPKRNFQLYADAAFIPGREIKFMLVAIKMLQSSPRVG